MCLLPSRHTQTLANTYAHTCMHAERHAYTKLEIDTCTSTHTYTHTHIRTGTHAQTHLETLLFYTFLTVSLSLSPSLSFSLSPVSPHMGVSKGHRLPRAALPLSPQLWYVFGNRRSSCCKHSCSRSVAITTSPASIFKADASCHRPQHSRDPGIGEVRGFKGARSGCWAARLEPEP